MWTAGWARRDAGIEVRRYGQPVPETTEPLWVAALRARDEEAWRALHDREFALLYRYSLGMGADAGIAEDAVNEAFTRLVTAIPRLSIGSPSGLRSWLMVVCRNFVRDHQRKQKRGTAPLDGTERVVDGDMTTRAALATALAALPANQREIVVLRFLTGLQTREVAAVTGRGVGAVESLQHRALRSLRRALGPGWEGS